MQNISEITGSCLSFPEAIAYKEHFACSADQEKIEWQELIGVSQNYC